MQIQPVLSLEQAERFCDTCDSFQHVGRLPASSQHVVLLKAIGVNKKSETVFSRWRLFYKLHGREAFIDYFARAIAPDYSREDHLRILKYAILSGTSIDRTWVLFKCSRRCLEKLSKRRNKHEADWPHVEPATPDPAIVRLLDEQDIDEMGQRTHSDIDILKGDTIIAMGSTAKELGRKESHRHIHGKSKQDVIALQRPPRKARRKDVQEAKKLQQAIKNAKQQSLDTLAALEESNQLPHIPIHLLKRTARAKVEQLALLRFANLKATLKRPSEYNPQNKGRKPYFDPTAKGFDQLPAEVQESSRAYYRLIEKAFLEASCVASQVPTDATQVERFKACSDFHQQHPEYPIKVVMIPFGFGYTSYKYYEKYRPRYISGKDPYLVSGAYACLIKCFKHADARYGKYRLRQMMYERGYHYCVPTIAKLMKRCNLHAVSPSSKSTSSYSSYLGTVGTLAPNLLERKFDATAPFQKVVSDVTELKFQGQKLYLSVFIDLFNNEVRAYSMSASPSVSFVLAGLKKLLKDVPEDASCIIHTDQGHQYQRQSYRKLFDKHSNIIQSMSRKGNCYDNGACEAWFARFKDDVIKGRSFFSMNELVTSIERYISFYNNERIQMGLQGKSPVAYAQEFAIAA